MRVYLSRHGLTAGNIAKQYIGAGSDLPLCPEGIEQLRRQKQRAEQAQFDLPERTADAPAAVRNPYTARRVYTSDMLRAVQTADILYPQAEQVKLAGLREMHFGSFEGKNWQQLQQDPDYTAWLEGMCQGRCPGGEDRSEFIQRTAAAFLWAVAREQGGEHAHDELSPGQRSCGEHAPSERDGGELHVVAHGGSIMALLHHFGGWDYFAAKTPPGGLWVCELQNMDNTPRLEVLQTPEGEALPKAEGRQT